MARVAWLHSSSLSQALLPSLRLRLRSTSLPFTFCKFSNFTSASCLFLTTTPCVRSNLVVVAQAARMISSKSNMDETASSSDLKFEAPLQIVKYPDPILRANNKRIVDFDENLNNLVAEMFDVMYRTDGIGLSAPQVGINVQLMVFNPSGERGKGEEIVLANPKVSRYSRRIVPDNEGCLSFPGIYADVVRPDSVRILAQDVSGAKFEFNLMGLPARVFQHEFDHLQGILFFDRMPVEVLESILADLQAMEKKYEEETGLPSPERVEIRQKRKAAVGFGKQR